MGAAGQRGQPILSRRQTHLIDRACSVRVDQCSGRINLHQFGNCTKFEPNCAIQGERRAYFNQLGILSEAFRSDLDLVDSICQARLTIQHTPIIRSERTAILVTLADDSNRAFKGQSSGISDR